MVSGVEDKAALPAIFQLSSNFPNPFNASTCLEIRLPKQTEISLTVFDVLGRKVKEIIHQEIPAGVHRFSWDGRDSSGQAAPSGVYLVRLNSPHFSSVKKMALVR
jgi:hypothetical protein